MYFVIYSQQILITEMIHLNYVLFCIFVNLVIKRPTRDACLCMGELQAPPAPHFVFLITL